MEIILSDDELYSFLEKYLFLKINNELYCNSIILVNCVDELNFLYRILREIDMLCTMFGASIHYGTTIIYRIWLIYHTPYPGLLANSNIRIIGFKMLVDGTNKITIK